MQIKVYTTTTCPYCKMLKEFLGKNNQKYEEVLVDQDHEGLEEMMGISDGHMGVPFSVVTKDDGTVVKIVGFDEAKFREALVL